MDGIEWQCSSIKANENTWLGSLPPSFHGHDQKTHLSAEETFCGTLILLVNVSTLSTLKMAHSAISPL